MGVATVVTRGYGNGTFSGSIADLVVRGYLPVSGNVTITLDAASMSFTGQNVSTSLSVLLGAAEVLFDPYAIASSVTVTLATAAMTFTAHAVSVLASMIISLEAATLNFVAHPITTTTGAARRIASKLGIRLGVGL